MDGQAKSAAINTVRSTFSKDEFSHRILDWIEDPNAHGAPLDVATESFRRVQNTYDEIIERIRRDEALLARWREKGFLPNGDQSTPSEYWAALAQDDKDATAGLLRRDLEVVTAELAFAFGRLSSDEAASFVSGLSSAADRALLMTVASNSADGPRILAKVAAQMSETQLKGFLTELGQSVTQRTWIRSSIIYLCGTSWMSNSWMSRRRRLWPRCWSTSCRFSVWIPVTRQAKILRRCLRIRAERSSLDLSGQWMTSGGSGRHGLHSR